MRVASGLRYSRNSFGRCDTGSQRTVQPAAGMIAPKESVQSDLLTLE